MWPFSRSAHVPTYAQWNTARTIDDLAVIRQRLAARHIRSLPREQRAAFAAGNHVSQSHRFVDAAQAYASRLTDHLAALGIQASVGTALYHYDRIILIAELARDPGDRLRTLPALFQGFEIKYDLRGAATATDAV
jgi:hypothetical protein